MCASGLRTVRPSVNFTARHSAAGGHDDGVPGLRLQYHPDYYAAFVVDPDGHRIEAVCHAPEKAKIV